MIEHYRKPAGSRIKNIKRSCAVAAVALVATLFAAPAASAFTIGTGDFVEPGVGMDAAGTAYVAWNGPENAQNVAPLRFCRLPRGATACDPAASSIATPGTSLSRPFITVSGERVVVVHYRYGAGVPGGSALYAYTSTNRGVSFGPGRVVGHVPFTEAVTGPADAMSGVTSAWGNGMGFQNVPLDGTNPQVDIGGASTRPWALLSTTHPYNGTVGLLDANTPLAVFVSGGGAAQASRYDGSGSLNDVNNWTQPIPIGEADYPKLAGGPSGLFLLAGPFTGNSLFVRKWTGSDFGASVPLGAGDDTDSHLFQDAAGRLHAVYQLGDANGRHLIHAVSDDGTAWRKGTVATETEAAYGFAKMRVATAPDHIGVVVWVGGAKEVRVAPVGPDAPGGTIKPPPPPVTPPLQLPPPVAPRPVVKPTPTLTATGSAKRLRTRVRIRIKGELLAPAGVPDARACKGTVIVSLRRATRPVATRTLTIDRQCEFGFTALVKKSKVKKARKLALRIQFLGNDVLGAVAKVGSVRVK